MVVNRKIKQWAILPNAANILKYIENEDQQHPSNKPWSTLTSSNFTSSFKWENALPKLHNPTQKDKTYHSWGRAILLQHNGD